MRCMRGTVCFTEHSFVAVFPEKEWQQEWSSRHSNDVYHADWSNLQIETYSQIQIPQIVQP